MTFYFDILSLCNHINFKYRTFAGHSISFGCANVRTFDTIMRMVDFLRNEKAARSCSFEATRNDGSVATLTVTLLDKENIHSAKAFGLQVA